MKKFGKKNKAFCHGDLTFENIVFDIKNNKVYFLDWENFRDKKEDWGYDLVYLLLSSLILPNIEKNKIKQNDISHFLSLWLKIKKRSNQKNEKKSFVIF